MAYQPPADPTAPLDPFGSATPNFTDEQFKAALADLQQERPDVVPAHRRALIIGSGTFRTLADADQPHPSLAPLPEVYHDIGTLHALLTSPLVGMNPSWVSVLAAVPFPRSDAQGRPYAPRVQARAWTDSVGSPRWPTPAAIRDETSRLVDELETERGQAGRGGLAVLYVFYSGHGLRGDTSRTGLPLADAEFSTDAPSGESPGYRGSIKSDWLDDNVFNVCLQRDVRCVLVIDACFARGVVKEVVKSPVVVGSSTFQVSKPISDDGSSGSIFIHEFARAAGAVAAASPDGLATLPMMVKHAGIQIRDRHAARTGQVPFYRECEPDLTGLVFAVDPDRVAALYLAKQARLKDRADRMARFDRLAFLPSPPVWLPTARDLLLRATDTQGNLPTLSALETVALETFEAHAGNAREDTTTTLTTADSAWVNLQEQAWVPWRNSVTDLSKKFDGLATDRAGRAAWERLAMEADALHKTAPAGAAGPDQVAVFGRIKSELRKAAVADEQARFTLAGNERRADVISENAATYRRLVALDPIGIVAPERLAEMKQMVNDRERWLGGRQEVIGLIRRATFDPTNASAGWLTDAGAALQALRRMQSDPASAGVFDGRDSSQIDDLWARYESLARLAAESAGEKKRLLALLAHPSDPEEARKCAARLVEMLRDGALRFDPLDSAERSLLGWYIDLPVGPPPVNATLVAVNSPVRIDLARWAEAARSGKARDLTLISPVGELVLSRSGEADRAVRVRARYFDGPPGPANREPVGEWSSPETATSNARTINLLLPDRVLPRLTPPTLTAPPPPGKKSVSPGSSVVYVWIEVLDEGGHTLAGGERGPAWVFPLTILTTAKVD